MCVAEGGAIATIPAGIDFRDAVVCEGAFYAYGILKRLRLGPGHKIMIYGASGAIGTAAVQLAKAMGAEVTAVVPTRHLALLKSIGADEVIDYTAGDFTKAGPRKTRARFDFVLDAVGKTSFFTCRRVLKPRGVFAVTDVGPYWQNLPLGLWSWITGSGRIVLPVPTRGSAREFIDFLRALIERGQFRAVIDRSYKLDDIAEAYRYVETGQKAGIVVIEVIGAEV